MPIVYHRELASGWIALWRIDESAEQLSELVCEADAARAMMFKSVSRRREWMAWRALVAKLLTGAVVGYDELGAPRLMDRKGFIGVSHEKEYVVVIYSAKERCAVDIENLNRDFKRVATRYVSQQERSLDVADDKRFDAVVWCAKEVLYKNAGRLELDFLKDIRIMSVDLMREEIVGRVEGGEPTILSLFNYENRLIVYTLLE